MYINILDSGESRGPRSGNGRAHSSAIVSMWPCQVRFIVTAITAVQSTRNTATYGRAIFILPFSALLRALFT